MLGSDRTQHSQPFRAPALLLEHLILSSSLMTHSASTSIELAERAMAQSARLLARCEELEAQYAQARDALDTGNKYVSALIELVRAIPDAPNCEQLAHFKSIVLDGVKDETSAQA